MEQVIEIKHAREMAGLSADAALRRPLEDERAERYLTMHRLMIIAAKGFAIRHVG